MNGFLEFLLVVCLVEMLRNVCLNLPPCLHCALFSVSYAVAPTKLRKSVGGDSKTPVHLQYQAFKRRGNMGRCATVSKLKTH